MPTSSQGASGGLSEAGETLLVREVDKGTVESLPNSDSTGCESDLGRLNSLPQAQGDWPGNVKNNAIRGERIFIPSPLITCHVG